MRADWSGEARAFIAEATKDLPESATLIERKRALRQVSWQFHGGTSWGKRMWGRECRRYLERHGQPPLANKELRVGDPSQAKLFAPDIIFPYRATG